jgi:hypothetical protein
MATAAAELPKATSASKPRRPRSEPIHRRRNKVACDQGVEKYCSKIGARPIRKAENRKKGEGDDEEQSLIREKCTHAYEDGRGLCAGRRHEFSARNRSGNPEMQRMLGVGRFKVNGPHHDVNILENESEDTSVRNILIVRLGITATLCRA